MTTPIFDDLLQRAADQRASDIHLAPGRRPVVRVDGELRPLVAEIPADGAFDPVLGALMNDAQRTEWKAAGRCEFMYSVGRLARFRVRVFGQHGGIGAAIRVLPREVPRLERLTRQQMAAIRSEKGLVVVAGRTGCGRTTTLASLLLEISSNGRNRVASIGRLVEFDLTGRLADLVQIGLGGTGRDYSGAIREACRDGAGVVVVDDASDPATMAEALNAADRGCLVLCGLAVDNPRWAVDELLRQHPEGADERRRLVADTLRAVFSQRWVGTVDGGRMLAFEVLLGTPALGSHIRQLGANFAMYSMMQTGIGIGNQTLDQGLRRLLGEGRINRAEARRHAADADVFAENGRSAATQPRDDVFARAASHHDGLIVVSGPAGSGRSGTAAQILSLVTAKRRLHVVTIEAFAELDLGRNPDDAGHITRHVIGNGPVDLASVVSAALREDPDVLCVTVESDAATLRVLTAAADSGVLVIATLASRSAVGAAELLAKAYPESPNSYGWRPRAIRAVFAHRLVPSAGGGRVVACEIMLGSPAVRNLIREEKFDRLQSAIEAGTILAEDAKKLD